MCQYSSAYVTAAVTWLRWENRNVWETRTEGFIQNDGDFVDVILLCWSNALTFSFKEAIRRTSRFNFLLLPLSNRCPMWRCTHSGLQLAEKNKFYTAGHKLCGTSLRNLLHTNTLAPRILKWCLGFWKVFDTASLIVKLPLSIYLKTFLQMVILRGTKQQQRSLDSWESIHGPPTANDTSSDQVCVLRLSQSALQCEKLPLT